MRTTKSTPAPHLNRTNSFLIFLSFLMLCSCKKSVTEVEPSSDNLVRAASMLDGNLQSGKIWTASGKSEIVLNYNNGAEIIRIEKLPGQDVDFTAITSASIIVSKYGLIIKGNGDNPVLLLINNDAESKNKFESVKFLFPHASESSIFGTTVIRAEKG